MKSVLLYTYSYIYFKLKSTPTSVKATCINAFLCLNLLEHWAGVDINHMEILYVSLYVS